MVFESEAKGNGVEGVSGPIGVNVANAEGDGHGCFQCIVFNLSCFAREKPVTLLKGGSWPERSRRGEAFDGQHGAIGGKGDDGHDDVCRSVRAVFDFNKVSSCEERAFYSGRGFSVAVFFGAGDTHIWCEGVDGCEPCDRPGGCYAVVVSAGVGPIEGNGSGEVAVCGGGVLDVQVSGCIGGCCGRGQCDCIAFNGAGDGARGVSSADSH